VSGQFHAPVSLPPRNESALETWWAPELGLNVFEDRKFCGVPGYRTPIYRSSIQQSGHYTDGAILPSGRDISHVSYMNTLWYICRNIHTHAHARMHTDAAFRNVITLNTMTGWSSNRRTVCFLWVRNWSSRL